MSDGAEDAYWRGEMQWTEEVMERLESNHGPCVYCAPSGYTGRVSCVPCSPECQALDDLEAKKEEEDE